MLKYNLRRFPVGGLILVAAFASVREAPGPREWGVTGVLGECSRGGVWGSGSGHVLYTIYFMCLQSGS